MPKGVKLSGDLLNVRYELVIEFIRDEKGHQPRRAQRIREIKRVYHLVHLSMAKAEAAVAKIMRLPGVQQVSIWENRRTLAGRVYATARP